MKKLLVTGGGGMVGSYVAQVFEDWEVLNTDIDTLDVRDPRIVMETVERFAPAVVLHLAAATDVDRCEQVPDLAFGTNAVGTQNVALACQKYGITLVYISTAGVFWGDKPTPYTEFDTPNPANVYGHSKLAGEQIIATLLNRYYTVRAGWMVGGGARDKKFVGKIATLFSEKVEEIKAVDDKLGSPTYARDLLGGIKKLLATDYFGLYHMVNTGAASRYEVALEIRRIVGRTDVRVTPVSSAYFPLPAPRARSEAMRNYKLELLGFPQQRSWQDALEEYLRSEYLPAMRSTRA